MKFIIEIGKGILIGAGCILPGISSGVLCVIFGIYEKLLDSILNFFKDINKNFKFLFPIALGGIILLLKNIKKEYKIKTNNIVYLIISLLIGILMVYLENKIGLKRIENINNIYLIISGIVMSIGIVVPGVSSTIILMLLGIYPIYLNSVSTLYLPVLIPITIGVITGSIIFMKIIKYLLDRFYVQTMCSIIGFTLGSIFVLLPEINTILELIIFVISIIFGYNIIKMMNN